MAARMKLQDGFCKTVPIMALIGILCIPALSGAVIPPEREEMYKKYLQFESYIKGGTIQPRWMADGSAFWYAEGMPDETVIYKVDPESNIKEPLFDMQRLRRILAKLMGREPPFSGLPFSTFEFTDGGKAATFKIEEQEFVLCLDSYEITRLPAKTALEKDRITPKQVHGPVMEGSPPTMELPSPDRRWFASDRDCNLVLRSTADGRYEQITSDGREDYAWNITGAQWSPNGLMLAAMKVNSREVRDVPLVHWLKTNEEVEWRPFTKAGGPLPQAEFHIVDILSKRVTRIDTGDERDKYLYVLMWLSNRSLLVARISREFKRIDVLKADAATGKTETIYSDQSGTFLQFPQFVPLRDGQRFLVTSEQDGWNHIYLHTMDGTRIRQITSGAYPVLQIVAADEVNGWIYFTAHAEKRLYDTHLYRITFKGRDFQRLTQGIGQHEIRMAPSRRFFIDTHSHIDRPPVTELRRADGTLVQTVSEADIDGLQDLRWQPPEAFVVKAADGKTDLYGILYKPFDFNPEKKYPVVEFIYGGPQISIVPRSFTGHALPNRYGAPALAHLGFIVMIVDARGTPERGKAFHDIVYGNFGRNEVPDHAAALRQAAAERPYMDMSRVGIFGGSWGGYMTIRAMLLAPEVYHVGIASYPVVDFYDHMAVAIETFMGLPRNDPAGYAYGSSLSLVENLKGRLFLIHGTSDVNATFSATMKMADALIAAGKRFDMLVLPGRTHRFYGTDRSYWRDVIRQYFVEHLKPYE